MKPVNVFTVDTRLDPEDPPGYRARRAPSSGR